MSYGTVLVCSAAITKYHLFLMVMEAGWEVQDQALPGWQSVTFSLCVHMHVRMRELPGVTYYKDTNPIRTGPHL